MPRPHPPEFRQRAVELARLREKPVSQIAEDLGISDSRACGTGWPRPTSTRADARACRADERDELVELRREARTLEAGERDPQAGGGLLRPGERPPKMIYTFIARACPDLPVAVCCRVMKVSTSGFYAWRAQPGS